MKDNALPLIAIMLLQPWWCAHSKPTTEQVKDARTIATCVANHWGEDWTQLIAQCAGPGLELFYDIVADNERTAIQSEPTADGGITRAPLGSKQPKRLLSHYANQPPITSRLLMKKPATQEKP